MRHSVNKFFDIGPDIMMVYAWFRSCCSSIVQSLKYCSLVITRNEVQQEYNSQYDCWYDSSSARIINATISCKILL